MAATLDIVEWLRREAELVALDRLSEAADEIERLRAQLAEYKFSPQFADELARQVDELEAENERLRECTPWPTAR